MNWDTKFLQLAGTIATWSKDPTTKIGAVVVDNGLRVRSTGYNGLPRGILDTPERLNNREWKNRFTVHAELNAILNAVRIGVSLEGCRLYCVGLPPCIGCATAIIQAGIVEVIIPAGVIVPEKWKQSCEDGNWALEEAGVVVWHYDPENDDEKAAGSPGGETGPSGS